MKHRLLKVKTILGFLLAFIMIVFPVKAAFANSIEIVGNDTGLQVVSSNKDLLNLSLTPGDSKTGEIIVKNTKSNPFKLYVKAVRLDKAPMENAPDLYKKLLIDTVYGGTALYSGSLNGFAGGDGIELGTLAPGETKKLDVKITLPGKETGNEFMGLTSSCQWIFTAVNEAQCALTVKVVDAATKSPLPGAVCAVYKDAALQQPLFENLVIDNNGQVVLEEMMPGTYYVKETKAPSSYLLNKITIPVTLQYQQRLTVIIENTAESPYQTGTEDYNMLIVGGLLLAAGSALIVLSKKKVKA